MTYEDIVEECRRLKREFEQDETRFMLGLLRIKKRYMKEFQRDGAEFENFLASHHLCEVKDYSAFIAGMAYVSGEEEAMSLGAPAVMALSKLHNRHALSTYKSEVAKFIEATSTQPLRRKAMEILLRVDPRERSTRKRTNRLLREENERLHKEVERLKGQVERLKGQVELLQEMLRDKAS